MKFKTIVMILLALGIMLIHFNSYAFPNSVTLRHVILLVFTGVACYFAYESRRRHLEEYEKLKRFLRICSWCNKICITDPETKEEKWISFAEYMAIEHKRVSSHGICPECFRRMDIYSDSTDK